MKNYNRPELVITGIGVTTAVGQGKTGFTSALLDGRHAFAVMQRSGRQENGTSFLGAEIPSLSFPKEFSKRLLRATSFAGQAALVTLHEAWEEAKLDLIAPSRIGLVVGGSNVQQRDLVQYFDSYRDRAGFIPPTYGLSFMDSDLCGFCTEHFGIRGLAWTVGGASASGQVAIMQAAQAVQCGQVDACIAMGALMDLSFWECQALRSLGAMGTDRYTSEPAAACRPFDKYRDGFIFGECCGAVVIERAESAVSHQAKPYAILSGWAIVMDGNRNPNPSGEGEVLVIEKALAEARLEPRDIDYINPHGTGSVIGDATELKAIHACRLSHAFINATKSITGHGLSAAGTVEVVATLLQMKESRLHPTRNLEDPLDTSLNWVGSKPIFHGIKNALTLSMGFGGINTALCLRKYENS